MPLWVSRAAFQAPGQSKVRDLRCAIRGEEDVGRLQVAVNDPAVVCHVHGFGQVGQQRGGLPRRLWRA
jgi:hypothetical protein